MRILVTGGAGFIGSHLVDAFVRDGHRVRVLDNLEEQVHGGKPPAHVNPEAEYCWGDVRDRRGVREALRAIDVVYHEAAAVGVGQSMYHIDKYTAANVLATSVLLDVVVNDRLPLAKMVLASSMSLYGEGQYQCAGCGVVWPALRDEAQLKARRWEMRCPSCQQEARPAPTPETKPLAPTSVYAISKQSQEALCLCVGRAYRIPTVALRYFNVYGPRQTLSNPYTGVCAIFSSRIKNRRAPYLFEDGRQSRDFIHVSDVVQANRLALANPAADGQVLNVGTGQATSIHDIAQTLIRLHAATIQPTIAGKYRVGDIRHCYADITRIRQMGFAPTVTLEDGLRDLVAWSKDQPADDRVEAATRELEAYGLAQG